MLWEVREGFLEEVNSFSMYLLGLCVDIEVGFGDIGDIELNKF